MGEIWGKAGFGICDRQKMRGGRRNPHLGGTYGVPLGLHVAVFIKLAPPDSRTAANVFHVYGDMSSLRLSVRCGEATTSIR